MAYGTGKNPTRGKISHLSRDLRSELNLRLIDGQSGREIIAWLNEHPEVKANAASNPDGWKITDANISNYKLGEFARWKKRNPLPRCVDIARKVIISYRA